MLLQDYQIVTSSRCNICQGPSKIGGRSQFLKIPKTQNVQTSSRPQSVQNHGENFEDPVVPLERNLFGHPKKLL